MGDYFARNLLFLISLALFAANVMAEQMKFVHYEKGGPEKMSIQTTDVPALRSREVLVKVYATALNRADTLQRRGLYPPPPGESEILGLEVSGTVARRAPDCTSSWKAGDRVMALLSGGGYAEYVAIPEDLLMPVPSSMTFTDAASIPEAWLTAYQLLHVVGDLQKGDTVLIHAGGSSVGVAAVQLCVLAGCKPIVTAGTEAKLQKAKDLGAVAAFNYKQVDFSVEVLQYTNGTGVDLILDCIGGSYYEKNIDCIRIDGRWVLYGLMGGGNVNADIFSKILRKRIRLTGTLLRSRSLSYKKDVVDRFTKDALPLFENTVDGKLVTVVDTVFPMYKVGNAHSYMESNQNNGKIVLQVRHEHTGATIHEEL